MDKPSEPRATQAEWAKREWFETQASQGIDDAASYFGHATSGYQRYRHRMLVAGLAAVEPHLRRDVLLDVGCAAGDLTALVGRHFGFKRIVGVDFVADLLAAGRKRFPDLEFHEGALPRIEFPEEQFDLVIASEVLYYLTDEARREAIEQIRRVLRKGGLLLFSAALGDVYFSQESAHRLISRALEPLETRLLRMKAYHAVTSPFYMASRVQPMLKGLAAPASQEARQRFERWRPWLDLPPIRAMVAAAAASSRPILASERLPAVLGRMPGAPTNIIVIARRHR